MSNYNRNNRSRGGGFGGGDFRRSGSGRREMHKAVCDKCGKDCEVPFRPSGDKPIFCNDCFEGKDGGSSRRSGRSGFEQRDNTNKQLLEQVSSLNVKLERILTLIESIVQKKPHSKKTKIKKVVEKAVPENKNIEKMKTSEKEAENTTTKD